MTGYIQKKRQKLSHMVTEFVSEMEFRLFEKMDAGRSDWGDPDLWSIEDITTQLIERANKSDFVDVANLAMFAFLKLKRKY